MTNGLTFKFGNSQVPTRDNPWILVLRNPEGIHNPSYEIFTLDNPEHSCDFGSGALQVTLQILQSEGMTQEQITQFMSDLDSGKGEGVTWFE